MRIKNETQKMVLACLRSETGSNIHNFWSFTMHSISSSNFFLRPWCNCAPFYSKRARYSVHLSDWSMGDILRKGNFFTDENQKWDTKNGFSLSTLRNRFQHSQFLKFHRALNIFIKLLFAALVQFDSVLVEESKICCSSHWFILWGHFKKKQIFHRCEEKSGFNLSTLKNSFQHLLLLKIHHALNIFFKLLLSALVHFHSVLVEESKIFCSSQRIIHGVDFKRSIFSQMRPKKWF